MNGRRQYNDTKAKTDFSKRKQKKETQMFTSMERYLGLDDIKNIIHNGDEDIVVNRRNGCLRANGVKKDFVAEKTDEMVIMTDKNGVIEIIDDDDDCQEVKKEEAGGTSPLLNVRLSPRKHASTLSRCAATSKENVITPHRISLCDSTESKTLTLNPYSKRTRRRLNGALDEQTLAETINNKTKNNHSDVLIKEEGEDKESKISNRNNISALCNNSDIKSNIILHTNVLANIGLIDSLAASHLDTKSSIKLDEDKVLNGYVNGKVPPAVVNGKNKPVVMTNGHLNGNRKLTEFFPVRRSVRKTKKEVQEEKHRAIELAILEEREEGLEVALFEGKGRGIVAARAFRRGEFVVEYAGELVSMQEAKEREAKYAQDSNKGCYMYYFKYNNQQYCIDATAESGRLGRLVNHSRNGNLVTKPVFLHHRPHLVLLAGQDITPGEEVTYDYGDRSKESLLAHPWLAL